MRRPARSASSGVARSLQPDEFQGLVATPIGVGLTWSRLDGPYDELMFRRVPLSAFGVSIRRSPQSP